MDNLFEFLGEPSFWIVTVFFGILINIASDWIRPLIERFIGKYSHKVRIRNIKRRSELEKSIEELIKDPALVIQLQLDIIYNLLVSILIPSIALFLVDFLWSITANGSRFIYFLELLRYLLQDTLLLGAIYGIASVAFFIALNSVFTKRRLYNMYISRKRNTP